MTGIAVRLLVICLLAVGAARLMLDASHLIGNPLPGRLPQSVPSEIPSLLPSLDVAVFEPMPVDAYTNLISRQILFRDRKFVGTTERPAEVMPTQNGSDQPIISVLGIWRENGDDRALVQAGEAPAQWAGVGDSVAGAVIVAIAAEGVTISRNGRESTIALYPPKR